MIRGGGSADVDDRGRFVIQNVPQAPTRWSSLHLPGQGQGGADEWSLSNYCSADGQHDRRTDCQCGRDFGPGPDSS